VNLCSEIFPGLSVSNIQGKNDSSTTLKLVHRPLTPCCSKHVPTLIQQQMRGDTTDAAGRTGDQNGAAGICHNDPFKRFTLAREQEV
jgi:hypothetical protein